MKLITLHLPTGYIDSLDQLVKHRFYPNRAEAIRFAVRDLLVYHDNFFKKSCNKTNKESKK